MATDALTIIGAAILGSALQELVYWYDLKGKLQQQRYVRLIHSPSYWIITGLMIVGAGLGTWIWYQGEPTLTLRQYFITGAAFPLLLKKAASALGAEKLHLGARLGPEGASEPGPLATYIRT